jgi:PPK2 family polyphosphate:nucleotide phosphotransferase
MPSKTKTNPPASPIEAERYLAKPGKPISLGKFATDEKNRTIDKEQGEALLKENIEVLSDLQEKLYAGSRWSVLVVFQAMDAAGKDSTLKHVMSGLNPAGVKVANFKTPSSTELDHDYFWRHYLALPGRGEIGIFNRSHYENVLITRVHPEYILKENLPGIDGVENITDVFWQQRFKQIRRFENNLSENGMLIIKFFLHVSKDEQKKRFLARIADPAKHWKFAAADIDERAHWEEYQKAYQEAIEATSTEEAPWYIIPADDKWYMQLVVSSILRTHLEKLNLQFPASSPKNEATLQAAKQRLESE